MRWCVYCTIQHCILCAAVGGAKYEEVQVDQKQLTHSTLDYHQLAEVSQMSAP